MYNSTVPTARPFRLTGWLIFNIGCSLFLHAAGVTGCEPTSISVAVTLKKGKENRIVLNTYLYLSKKSFSLYIKVENVPRFCCQQAGFVSGLPAFPGQKYKTKVTIW